MGTTIDFQQPIVSTSKTIMKLFLIAAILIASVCAEPESEAKADAKPWLAYSNYGYAGYPYAAGYAAYPYAGVYGAGYNGYATGYHYLGKRSADSESDAKPWLTYANYGYQTNLPRSIQPSMDISFFLIHNLDLLLFS